MNIELQPMVGVCLRTKKPQPIPQDRIMVDGIGSGYIAHEPGSRILMIRRFSTSELEEIQTQVDILTKRKSSDIVQTPAVPENFGRQDEDEDDVDDFDDQ